jgi:hypothetical protein
MVDGSSGGASIVNGDGRPSNACYECVQYHVESNHEGPI